MVSSKTLLLVGAIAAIYVVSISFYIYNVDAENAAANSVNVYVEIIGGPPGNATASYLPDKFIVVDGEHVTLVVSNKDSVTHELVILAFGVSTGAIPGGGSASVTFVPKQTGTFEFDEPLGYCGGGASGTCNSVQQLTGNMTVSP